MDTVSFGGTLLSHNQEKNASIWGGWTLMSAQDEHGEPLYYSTNYPNILSRL